VAPNIQNDLSAYVKLADFAGEKIRFKDEVGANLCDVPRLVFRGNDNVQGSDT
jgi:hypothetical protein